MTQRKGWTRQSTGSTPYSSQSPLPPPPPVSEYTYLHGPVQLLVDVSVLAEHALRHLCQVRPDTGRPTALTLHHGGRGGRRGVEVAHKDRVTQGLARKRGKRGEVRRGGKGSGRATQSGKNLPALGLCPPFSRSALCVCVCFMCAFAVLCVRGVLCFVSVLFVCVLYRVVECAGARGIVLQQEGRGRRAAHERRQAQTLQHLHPTTTGQHNTSRQSQTTWSGPHKGEARDIAEHTESTEQAYRRTIQKPRLLHGWVATTPATTPKQSLYISRPLIPSRSPQASACVSPLVHADGAGVCPVVCPECLPQVAVRPLALLPPTLHELAAQRLHTREREEEKRPLVKRQDAQSERGRSRHPRPDHHRTRQGAL